MCKLKIIIASAFCVCTTSSANDCFGQDVQHSRKYILQTIYRQKLDQLWADAIAHSVLKNDCDQLVSHGIVQREQIVDRSKFFKINPPFNEPKNSEERKLRRCYFALREGVREVEKAYRNYRKSITDEIKARRSVAAAEAIDRLKQSNTSPAAEVTLACSLKSMNESRKKLVLLVGEESTMLIDKELHTE